MSWLIPAAFAADKLSEGQRDVLGWVRDQLPKGMSPVEVANARNEALQKEFAQHGVRWRVDDARAAGIHPLAAMGAQLHGAAASFMPEMGQDVTRAVAATSTSLDKVAAVLQLQNMGLQNELLAAQIAKMQGPSFPDATGGPLPGQGDVVVDPRRVTPSVPGAPGVETGAVPDLSYVRTSQGYSIAPSSKAKELQEDDIVQEVLWHIRNRITSLVAGGPTPPDPKLYPLPKGYDQWEWYPLLEEFRPGRKDRLF